jgi:hypothetical protein
MRRDALKFREDNRGEIVAALSLEVRFRGLSVSIGDVSTTYSIRFVRSDSRVPGVVATDDGADDNSPPLEDAVGASLGTFAHGVSGLLSTLLLDLVVM